jgi:hypothetical protein
LLEAGGRALVDNWEMRPETEVTSICLSDIDQRADDVHFNPFVLLVRVGFHGSNLVRKRQRGKEKGEEGEGKGKERERAGEPVRCEEKTE